MATTKLYEINTITVMGEDAFWKKYSLTDKLPELKA